jgi:hypothetical protein
MRRLVTDIQPECRAVITTLRLHLFRTWKHMENNNVKVRISNRGTPGDLAFFNLQELERLRTSSKFTQHTASISRASMVKVQEQH